MKIALAGPSGTGKTTIANFISQEFNLEFIKGSAGLILTDEDKLFLSTFGYEQRGHIEVLKLSSNPMFSFNFETSVLKRRAELIQNNHKFITDRSPVDNLCYFLLQAAWGVTTEQTATIIEKCQDAFTELTHLIYIPINNPGDIENNNSRIPNIHFQRTVDAIFKDSIGRYFSTKALQYRRRPKILELNHWDLSMRKEAILKFLKR